MKTRTSPAHVVSQQDRVFPPGSPWNYVKLYCTPAQQDEIIARPLSDLISLLSEQKLIDHWFFLRYADPSPHLRLRIHTSVNEQIEPALSALLTFCRELVTRGMIQRLTLDTYEREIARYGGPAAMNLLEQVMCLDSQMCQKLVAAHYTHRLTLDPLTIACVSLDRFFDSWGYDQQRCLKWLEKRVEKYAFRKEFHSKRKHYSSLLTRMKDHVAPELLAQHNLVLTLIAPIQDRLAELAAQVWALAQSNHL